MLECPSFSEASASRHLQCPITALPNHQRLKKHRDQDLNRVECVPPFCQPNQSVFYVTYQELGTMDLMFWQLIAYSFCCWPQKMI